jgi:hypothetical protein
MADGPDTGTGKLKKNQVAYVWIIPFQ